MEDRGLAWRDINTRRFMGEQLSKLGPELTLMQLLLIKDWIEYAKQNPDEETLKLVRDGNRRT